MNEQLTKEQQRIAEISGTVDVLERLLVTILAKSSKEGSLDDKALKDTLAAIIEQSYQPQENNWGDHYEDGKRATASRIGGMIGMGQILTKAAKQSSAGEA